MVSLCFRSQVQMQFQSEAQVSRAVANGGNSRRDKEGLCCEPDICLRERMWEAEV